ncbi:MAG TPA: hypothetical protein VHV54_04045 [Candidatus Binatia bacterium]|nr:hypothetical protein [Candidatus Binatia bacterium]
METTTRNPANDMPSGHADQPYRDRDSNVIAAENQVEALVSEISRVINAAEPEKRAGLKELAETLLHDEVSSIADAAAPPESGPLRYSSNPLLAGLLLIVLGLGLLLILPPVGATIAFFGVVLAAWGGFISWFRK